MRGSLTVGTATASPGTRAHGALSVPGVAVRLPVIVLRGSAPGPTLVITAGIHGAEYVGIEAAIRAAASLDVAALRGTVIVVPVANPPAFAARAIGVCPLDGRNLNRVFPGRPDGTASERIAHTLLTQVIRRADAYVDLHGGDLHEALEPFVLFCQGAAPEVVAKSRAMAETFGLGYVVAGGLSGATVEAASSMGIPAILPEAGGQGILDERMVGLHLRGIHRVLAHLDMLGSVPEAISAPVPVSEFLWVRSSSAGLFYPSVSAGQQVSAGQAAGEIRDWFGERIASLSTPAAGVVLFVTTTLATNPGDPLFAIGVPA
ncbi:MAG: M14 family metallopeptidase [Armatimonadota bacterium]|nr:M14 family metallopeptidase [Armatimonadota bacterium]